MAEGQSITPGASTIMASRSAITQGGASISPQDNLNQSWVYLNDLLSKQRSLQNNLESSKLNLLPIYTEEVKAFANIGSNPELQRLQEEAKAKEQAYLATHAPSTGGSGEMFVSGFSKYKSELDAERMAANNALQTMKNTQNAETYAQAETEYQNSKNKITELSKLSPDQIKSQYTDEVKPIINRGAIYAPGWGVGGRLTSPGGTSEIEAQQKSLQAQQTQTQLASMIERLTSQGQRLTPSQIEDYTQSIKSSGGLVGTVPRGLLNQLSTQAAKITLPSSQTEILAKFKPDIPYPEVIGKEARIKEILDNPSKYTNRQVLNAETDYNKLLENNIRLADSLHHFEKTEGEKYNIPMFNPFDLLSDISLINERIIHGVETAGLKKYGLPAGTDYSTQQKNNQQEFLRQFGLPSNLTASQVIDTFQKNPELLKNSPYGSPELTNLIFQGYFPESGQAPSTLPEVKLTNWYDQNIRQNPAKLDQPFKIANTGITPGFLNILSEKNQKRPFVSVIQPEQKSTLDQMNEKVAGLFGIGKATAYEQAKTPVISAQVKSAFEGYTLTPYGKELPASPEDTGLPFIPTEISQSESWITGLPVFGGVLSLADMPKMAGLPGISDLQVAIAPTSKMAGVPFFGNIARDASQKLATEYNYGPATTQKINEYTSGQAARTRLFVNPETGEATKSLTRNVGEPVKVGEAYNVGEPKITTSYNPLTGETTTITEQATEQKYAQPQETTTLPEFETIAPITAATKVIGGSTFQNFQKGIVDSTYGRVLPENITPNYEKEGLPGIITNRLYTDIRNKPLDLLGDYVAGAAVGKVIGLGKTGVAAAAESTNPFLSRLGRAASTPLAQDIGTVSGLGLGGAVIGLSAADVMSQPTMKEKAERATDIGLTFALFGKGMKDYYPVGEPVNKYAGREYFSGERKLPYTTQLRNIVITKAEKPFSASPQSFEDVSTIFRGVRNKEPQPGIKQIETESGLGYGGLRGFTEPNIAEAATIGPKRAPAVREALIENKAVLKGSVVVPGQVSGMASGTEAARAIKDIDVLSPDQSGLITSLASKRETPTGLDIKSPELGYPDVFGKKPEIIDQSIQGEGGSLIQRIFGTPIRARQGEKLPYSDELHLATGKLGEEALNVQFARKAQAMQEDLIPGNQEQYRLMKDSKDFVSIGRDLIHANQAKAGIRVGTPTKELKLLESMKDKEVKMDFVPKEDMPTIGAKAGVRFQKTMTYGEMWKKMDKMSPVERSRLEWEGRPDTLAERARSAGSAGSAMSVVKLSAFASPLISGKSPVSSKSMMSSVSSRSSSGVSSRISSMASSSILSSISPSAKPSRGSSVDKSVAPSISPSASHGKSSSGIYSPSSGYGYSFSYGQSPSSSFIFKTPGVPGAPWISPPGSSGSGGKGRGGFDLIIKNPLEKLSAGSEITGFRTSRVFSGRVVFQNKNLFPQNKSNVRPVQTFVMPNVATRINKPKAQKNNLNYINMDLFSTTGKKKKKGTIF